MTVLKLNLFVTLSMDEALIKHVTLRATFNFRSLHSPLQFKNSNYGDISRLYKTRKLIFPAHSWQGIKFSSRNVNYKFSVAKTVNSSSSQNRHINVRLDSFKLLDKLYQKQYMKTILKLLILERRRKKLMGFQWAFIWNFIEFSLSGDKWFLVRMRKFAIKKWWDTSNLPHFVLRWLWWAFAVKLGLIQKFHKCWDIRISRWEINLQ